MTDREDKDVALNLLAGIGIGAIIGAVTALMLAPKSGVETREDIKKTLDDLRDKSEGLISDWSTAMDEQLQRTKKLYEDARTKLATAVDAGKKAAGQKIEEIEGGSKAEAGDA